MADFMVYSCLNLSVSIWMLSYLLPCEISLTTLLLLILVAMASLGEA